MMTSSLAWAFGITLLMAHSGCVTITYNKTLTHSDPVTVESERVEVLSPPEAAIRTHPDGGGWTVETRERIARITTESRQDHWQGDKLWLSPLAPMLAVLCPTQLLLAMLAPLEIMERQGKLLDELDRRWAAVESLRKEGKRSDSRWPFQRPVTVALVRKGAMSVPLTEDDPLMDSIKHIITLQKVSFLQEALTFCLLPAVGIVSSHGLHALREEATMTWIEPRQGAERRVDEWRPASGGSVTVQAGAQSRTLRFPIDQDGQTSIRIGALALPEAPGPPGRAVPLSLTVEREQRILARHEETIAWARWQTARQVTAIPAELWPRPLVLGLIPLIGADQDGRLALRFRSRVLALSRRHGIPLVSRERADEERLAAERAYQLSGRVEDRSAAGIGHERGASVLIVPKLTGTKHNTLTIELVATQSGELLGDVAVEAGGDDQDLLVDAASGRLEALLAPISRSTEHRSHRSAGSPR